MGAWLNEPSELYFTHNGLKCAIFRVMQLGHLCGYVGVNDLGEGFEEDEIHVHGGVTFFERTENLSGKFTEYFTDCEYVIGFDCAHWNDVVPFAFLFSSGEETYKDIEYVTDETKRLAEQMPKKVMEESYAE
ncbi:hypothetical protein AAXB25_15220 [Paenibacillus lautus]|uniref:hypothetical protein n=1 Tax=Paenibacillus lautus TaxID=1401 RepID=UPI003D278140